MKCEICGTIVGLNGCRMGVCFDCAEAESVIADGTDMRDNKVAETPKEKLKYILSRAGRLKR
jgi:ribosome-binding protein aMBF1 (putative translation factor)